MRLRGAFEVITTINSFHGRTLAMVAATGQEKYQRPYIPMPDGFVNVEYDDVAAVKKATTARTCAVMLEAVQGEGGVNIPQDNYLKEVRQWCDQKHILLILDEIQTGMGRMGSLFAYQQCEIEPDIMTLAKGLGSGVPIGAVLTKEEMSLFEPGDHGTTFGGNPLACAAGYATLKFMVDNRIPHQVSRVSKHLMDKLQGLQEKFPCVSDVRGRGLLAAIQFHEAIADDVLLRCLKKGLLINKVGPDILRLMPPLIVAESDVSQAVEILQEALMEVSKPKSL